MVLSYRRLQKECRWFQFFLGLRTGHQGPRPIYSYVRSIFEKGGGTRTRTVQLSASSSSSCSLQTRTKECRLCGAREKVLVLYDYCIDSCSTEDGVRQQPTAPPPQTNSAKPGTESRDLASSLLTTTRPMRRGHSQEHCCMFTAMLFRSDNIRILCPSQSNIEASKSGY